MWKVASIGFHCDLRRASAIATPVRLKAVKLPPRWRTSIRLPEEPTLSCQFGERFGHWLRDLVAPLIAGEFAVELKSVHTGPGYECRNRAETGKISAHASGLAELRKSKRAQPLKAGW